MKIEYVKRYGKSLDTCRIIYAPMLFLHLQIIMTWLSKYCAKLIIIESFRCVFLVAKYYDSTRSNLLNWLFRDVDVFSIGMQAKLCEGNGALCKMARGGRRGGITGL